MMTALFTDTPLEQLPSIKLSSINKRINQHLNVLGELREKSAFEAAKLVSALKDKEDVLKDLDGLGSFG